MFTVDLFSSIPTRELSAEEAFDAYWAVATSESNALSRGDNPIYRFARDYMLRAIMRDYGLRINEAAWLYDELIPEGPGWGSLNAMVGYGRDHGFGRYAVGRAVQNCLTCREGVRADYDNEDDFLAPSNAHSIDCPMRKD